MTMNVQWLSLLSNCFTTLIIITLSASSYLTLSLSEDQLWLRIVVGKAYSDVAFRSHSILWTYCAHYFNFQKKTHTLYLNLPNPFVVFLIFLSFCKAHFISFTWNVIYSVNTACYLYFVSLHIYKILQWKYCKHKFKWCLRFQTVRQTENSKCLPVWFVTDHVTFHKGSWFKHPDLTTACLFLLLIIKS